jgi:hypothetical protein
MAMSLDAVFFLRFWAFLVCPLLALSAVKLTLFLVCDVSPRFAVLTIVALPIFKKNS